MKNIGAMLFIAVLLLPSCGICEDDPGAPNNSDIIGTFRMTSWNAPVAVDIDQNGTASRNLMIEIGCYDDSQIVLSANHTYTMSYHFAAVGQSVLSCEIETTSGTWSRTGNTLRLTSNGATKEYAYGAVNHILTRSESNWDYPTANGNIATYANGDVNMVFTKQ